MYYAARDRASNQWCLTYATAPAANAVFVDRDGTPYLLWKTHASPGSSTSVVVGAPLTADGRRLAGPTRTLLASDGGWDGTIIENPAMTLGSDGYTLLFSGNSFDTDRYATGIARCAGPLGPCTRVSPGPAHSSSPRSLYVRPLTTLGLAAR
jgi:hypothetical protein